MNGNGLKRAIFLTLWMALAVSLLALAREPLLRLQVVYRLWHQELRPPLLVPVKGVPRKALFDSWGAPRSGGRRHEGIDIMASCGRPVVSATEGIVLSAGDNTLGGHVVWVLGPAGSLHYYAHLSRFAEISRGQHVLPGDPLGYVGNTGNAAGGPCHLHYGIYDNGKAHDPYAYLKLQDHVAGRKKLAAGAEAAEVE